MKQSITLLCIIVCFSSLLKAQQLSQSLITTSGDIYATQSMSLSWSLGEVVTETFTADNLTLTQGFQQVSDAETAIKPTISESQSSTIYPNPAKSYFNLSIESKVIGNLHNASIYDLNGKKIKEIALNQDLTHVKTDDFIQGLYLIRIVNTNFENTMTHYLQIIK
jgi:hypothetical protein